MGPKLESVKFSLFQTWKCVSLFKYRDLDPSNFKKCVFGLFIFLEICLFYLETFYHKFSVLIFQILVHFKVDPYINDLNPPDYMIQTRTSCLNHQNARPVQTLYYTWATFFTRGQVPFVQMDNRKTSNEVLVN